MGNCQAAEAATVLIHRPGGGVERIYWSVSAREVMSSNPGHYVAMVVAPAAGDGAAARQLKLLRTDDVLRLGQVYRLVSFEDVVKEFTAKKSAKLGKLLRETLRQDFNCNSNSNTTEERIGSSQSGSGNRGKRGGGRGQWKPALQSIAEGGEYESKKQEGVVFSC